MDFSTFLWGVFPYICLVLLVAGLIWRFHYDQYGWTTRSSQLYESAWLRAASPLFHFGIIFVFFGHVAGLLIPKSFTEAMGISQHAYHMGAVIGGGIAGMMTLVGLVGLLIRRFKYHSVRLATTGFDKFMYVLLCLPIALGSYATFTQQMLGGQHGYDYRETISPWLRSLFTLSPQVELMQKVPISFQLHIVAAFLLFAIWPFTRLVHVLSVPVGYTTRPYLVYRARPGRILNQQTRRGWRGINRVEHGPLAGENPEVIHTLNGNLSTKTLSAQETPAVGA